MDYTLGLQVSGHRNFKKCQSPALYSKHENELYSIIL